MLNKICFWRAITLCCALVLPTGAALAAGEKAAIPVRVVVATMFENGEPRGDEAGEMQLWVERSEISAEFDFPMGEYPLFLTRDGVLIVCLGGGIPNATASIMALGLDPRFDLSKAYWLIAGIAGGDPEDVSLGSAVWARDVVDGDLVYEIDGREIPDSWPYGFIPLGAKEPAEGPQDVSDGWTLDTISFALNEPLVDWAYELTRDTALADMPGIAAFRAQYDGYPNAQRAPFVTRGETLSASTYWHGRLLNTWANDWIGVYAGAGRNFMTSNMEDSGTLTALHRLHRIQRVDADRVLILRTVSNYTMPPRDKTAAWSTTAPYPDNGLPALEAAWRVGSTVVDELVTNWDQYVDTLPGYVDTLPGSATAPAAAIPVIFDTDMAIDDWAALLFLARHPRLDLRAVTVAGSGEAHCAPAVRNALALLELAAPTSAAPVTCGDPWPLDGWFVFPPAWQDDMDSLSGVAVPASKRTAWSGHAVDLLHEALLQSPQPAVILATGPLTNIAQWLEKYPDDRSRVARVVIMGGAVNVPGNIIVPGFTDGNPNTRAEWNLYVDPVAAQRVFAAGLPIELVGLDVTNHVRVTTQFAATFKARANNPAAAFWDAVLDANDWFIDSGEYYFWDVLAALTVVDPQRYCRGEQLSLSVAYAETDAPWTATSDMTMPASSWSGVPRRHLDAATAGMLVADASAPPALVCLQTDAQAAFALFLDTLTGVAAAGQ